MSAAAIRAAIRGEVELIVPLDEVERTHQAEALTWIDSGAPLCRTAKPATPPKHLVSYFAVVDGDNILLVDHKSAQHEIAEPLMLTCTTTVGLTAGHADVSLWYVVTADRTSSVEFDREEFAGVQWFEFADVPLHRSDPHIGRFLAKLACARKCIDLRVYEPKMG